jgi:hypothetical protein
MEKLIQATVDSGFRVRYNASVKADGKEYKRGEVVPAGARVKMTAQELSQYEAYLTRDPVQRGASDTVTTKEA